jgi:DNA helicase-2/ATP-dependent DNA helicase PcrA
MIGRAHEVGLSGATMHKVNEFVLLIRSFAVQLELKNAYDLGHQIASESGLLKELYSDRTPEGVARYDNIQELLNGMKEFSDKEDPEFPEKLQSLGDFLIDIALLTDADNEDKNDEGKVSLMTIHAAKGLEFPYVNIVGLEEQLFPSQLSINSREELEEERRLFYVALTRAEKKATLSYALTRYRWGQLQYCEPSRFIEEIDEQYLDMPSAERTPTATKPIDFRSERGSFFNKSFNSQKPSRPIEPTPEPSTPVAPPAGFKKISAAAPTLPLSGEYAQPGDLEVGSEVVHEKFGKGKVITLEGDMPDIKATIFFPSAGQKQLLLKFAKLKLA